MLEWLIVGGGIHGTHLSLVLRNAGVSEAALRVLDPWEGPMARWTELTSRTGMTFLRSPGVHHIGLEPYDLFRFAGRRRARDGGSLRGRYRRPSLELFQAHAQARISEATLEALREQGWATDLCRIPGGFRVETNRGALESRRVILALGAPSPEDAPHWAREWTGDGSVRHLFGGDLDLDLMGRRAIDSGRPVAVVGGGISAAQVALRLTRQGAPVLLLARTPLRVHPFDSDPGWLGPKYLRAFHGERSPRVRRALLEGARHRGSMPEEVAGALRVAVERETLEFRVGEIIAGRRATPEGVSLELLEAPADGAPIGARGSAPGSGEGRRWIKVSTVLLATGAGPGIPGDPWLAGAAHGMGLPTGPCGFPVPHPSLRWTENLYVTGALAELEVGPASRNIAGARMAAERIREAVTS
ncbi:MAG: hypothetical protein EA421_05005 [Gemmatimonadales bacterium]|nr:MAG: hypothetical protein EA421_05005 [Gemmatimonadales bacterium]